VQSIDGFPGIIEIVKERDEKTNWGGINLHSDLTFFEEPPIGAALYAREVPPHGGDTLFVNMYLAYETLSDGMKALLSGLRGVHISAAPASYSASFKGMREKHNEAGSAVHPMVITHPHTGRKSLYSNAYTKHFENMSIEESRPILDYLASHAARPEFNCRFHWTPGSLVMWDNRVTMHYAIEDDFGAEAGNGYRRVMHRATFAGERPH
jgi:taurine dioxygenase